MQDLSNKSYTSRDSQYENFMMQFFQQKGHKRLEDGTTETQRYNCQTSASQAQPFLIRKLTTVLKTQKLSCAMLEKWFLSMLHKKN